MALSSHKVTKWNLIGFTLFYLSFSLVINVYAEEPRTPNDDGEVLEIVKTSNNKGSSKLKKIREQLKISPNNIALASQLVRLYIEIGRENTDVRYYGYAQAVLSPWWNKKRPPAEILLLRATLNQQKHDYKSAIADLKLLLKQQPKNIQAWLTLSIIQQVLGNYESARSSCSALARTRSSWLSTLCHSQVLGFTGSAERAFKMQQSLLLQLGGSRLDLKQWVLGINAETALRLGRRKQAEALFKAALEINLRDAYLLRVYSDYLLAENRADEVIKLLKGEEQDSALLLRLAIAAQQLVKKDLTGKYQKLLTSRFKAASLRGSNLHERDEALYLLEFKGDISKGLSLARDNWSVQKEPDDALILLRLAIKSNSESDVGTIRNWMKNNKLQDQRLHNLLEKNNKGEDSA